MWGPQLAIPRTMNLIEVFRGWIVQIKDEVSFAVLHPVVT